MSVEVMGTDKYDELHGKLTGKQHAALRPLRSSWTDYVDGLDHVTSHMVAETERALTGGNLSDGEGDAGDKR